ncbi:nuclear transport factor 2 family protein [Sinirhodobacter populi]|uniref:Nuclear transport factor 2 family protein n=1 Tax=Paenirhodobacter populi TaxID=2306993 RepID=A0A443K3B5_9RHOB|nr:nuclear transport factor 2 family protein [Sinirhodobacter populi]RWR27235.1 nuclear transport factor 2 family protein [Sinirhodobacter populi]
MTGKHPLSAAVDALIKATNAFDIEAALALFTPDAVIDDASVGDSFVGQAGVRDYLQRFFVGYHTSTRLLSITDLDRDHVRVRVDFTGDFGHEVGLLEIAFNAGGLIAHVDADLE